MSRACSSGASSKIEKAGVGVAIHQDVSWIGDRKDKHDVAIAGTEIEIMVQLVSAVLVLADRFGEIQRGWVSH